MESVIRRTRKRKRTLGEVRVLRPEEYEGLAPNVKVELIRDLIPLALLHVRKVLQEEVESLAGRRYARGDGAMGTRHGSNPGSVVLAGQRIPIRVPRVRGDQAELPLQSYPALHGTGEVDDVLLGRVLHGISCRNYESAAQSIPGAIGLSSSSVSRAFVEASATKLRELLERSLGGDRYVSLFLDGKTFGDTMMVIALGVTSDGTKRFLGFVETDTENEKVLTAFLRSLIDRGLDASAGLLVVIDGSKGLRAAVRRVFLKKAAVQRCMWHKRENVVSYLAKDEQQAWRRRLQQAYDRPTYKEAKAALLKLHRELSERNQSAADSLLEGLEETLTLHRLGVYGVLGRSFKTTNCLESANAQIEQRCSKVDAWKTSNQRQRWLAASLLDIEPRLRRVKGHGHLPLLVRALATELKIKPQTRAEEQAA